MFQMPIPKASSTRIKIFRIFSIILVVASILFFFYQHDPSKMMAIYSLLMAALFLVFYGDWNGMHHKHMWVLAIPVNIMIGYNIQRVLLFFSQGFSAIHDVLYTLEVFLLATAYTFFVILILTDFKFEWMRIAFLAMCGVCIALGVWSFIDGTWVLFNRTSLELSDRLNRYFFYYISDTCFWILPFAMTGSVAWHKKLS